MERGGYSFRGGCGRGRGGHGGRGGMFAHPHFGHGHGFEGPDFSGAGGFPEGFGTRSGFGSGTAFNPWTGFGFPFGPEMVAAGLRGLFNTATPFLQEVVSHLDEKTVEEAIRLLIGETANETRASSSESSQQFGERVTVDKSGDTEKHRVDINLGVDAKADSLKISRKDHVMTINVKTEKSAEDGSSRLYQEYTKKITLPENVDLSQLESSLSAEGVLTIQAPFLPKAPVENKPPGTRIPVILDDSMTD